MSEVLPRVLGVLLLVGALGAAGYAAWSVVPDVLPPGRGLAVSFFEGQLNGTAGRVVAFPVLVTNAIDEPRNVTLRVETTAPVSFAPIRLDLAPRDQRGLWLNFTLDPAPAAGTYRIDLLADPALTARDVARATATLRVLAPAAGIDKGDVVTLRFVGVFPDGRVFDGSLPFANNVAFPRVSDFKTRVDPFTWTFNTTATEPISGILPFVRGMQAGEARTVVVPAATAFGEKRIEDMFPRRSILPIEIRTLPGEDTTTRRVFAQWLSDTQQKPAIGWRVGETVTWRLLAGPQPIPVKVKILAIGSSDESNVRFEFPAVDEPMTIFSQAPFQNATRIESKSETTWILRTVPRIGIGEPFTFVPYWPNASRITSCAPTCDFETARNATVTHLDDSWVGRRFLYEGSGFPLVFNVTSVEEDGIRVFALNPHPFAGNDITYHLRVVDVKRP